MLYLFAMKNWTIEIDFVSRRKESEPLCFKWSLLEHFPAFFWVKKFKAILEGNLPYYARFTGFPGGEKNYEYLSSRLNQVIDIINREGLYFIEERPQERFTQAYSNIIHHHFEILFGSIEKRSEYYQRASRFCQQAIQDLNHIIHDMETLEREIERETLCPNEAFSAIISEVLDVPIYRMPDEFLGHHSLDIEFGDLVAHYGLVGKTWWEVYLDQDEEIFEDAIRPMDVITGEFDIFWGQYSLDKKGREDFYKFLRSKGQDPNNKRLALGYLPIAKFIRELDLTNVEYKRLLAQKTKIQEIRLLNNHDLVASRNFKNCLMIDSGFSYQSPVQVVKESALISIKQVRVQCIPIRSDSGPVVLNRVFFEGWPRPEKHNISLVGIGDEENAIVLRRDKVGDVIDLLEDEVRLFGNWQIELEWSHSESCYCQTGLRKLDYF